MSGNVIEFIRNGSKEFLCCVLLLGTVAVYSLVYILQVSADYNGVAGNPRLQVTEGWQLMSRKKDIADFEWFFWFSEARHILISILVGHLAVSLVAQYFFLKIKSDLLCLFGIAAVWWLFGAVYVSLIFIMTIFYIYLANNRTSSMVVLSSTVFLLATYHLPHGKYNFYLSEVDCSILTKSGLSFAILRCCSCALEAKRNLSMQISVFELLKYNFYIPFFFFGPLMTYNNFTEQNTKPAENSHLYSFAIDVIRAIIKIIFIDFLRHFLYVSSLPQDEHFMTTAPSAVIGVLAFLNVFLDWVKGQILYCVSSGIARKVDGYKGAPTYCKNVATVFTFADTYFDRGLQQFICRYVYDAYSPDHQDFTNEAFAGGLSFLVVIVTQGMGLQVWIWAFLNWVGLTIEFFFVKRFGNELREVFRCLLFGLNYWAILILNCIAINGFAAFQLYFYKIFIEGGVSGFTVAMAMGYCYVRVNVSLRRRSKSIKKD